jgi:thioesterase domain-containing protein
MARQLLAQGEEVLQVIMLDTPLARIARFSRADRLSMLWQTFKRSKDPITFVRERIRSRMEWHKKLEERANQREDANDAARFQSRRIGDAFMRSVAKYDTRPVPVRLALFRPKLDVRFHLSGGRRVDGERNYVSEDNGWTQYVSEIQVYEVPGNHDSMVLEPNVRVLVGSLRRAIKAAEEKSSIARRSDPVAVVSGG